MFELPGNGSARSRRSFLGTVGAAVGATALTGRAAAGGGYDTVDIVEAGADNDGGESITPILEDVVESNTRVYFPPGRYYMDEQLRFTGFEKLWLDGNGATIVPAPADEYKGEARLFKLGTYYAPGEWLRIGGLTFDFTAENTGLRAIQAQVNDAWIHDVNVVGEHDAGTWGPLLVDILDPDAVGAVDRVSMPDGGEFTKNTPGDANPTVNIGPTGFIVSPYHEGTLWVRDCVVGPFPDNGLYDSSGDTGTVQVYGGEFRNSNVANIRLEGDNALVDGATVVVNENREDDVNQRGIRLDGGEDVLVTDTSVYLNAPNGHAITVMSEIASATIRNTQIRIGGDDVNDGIVISDGAGDVQIDECDIVTGAMGQAIQIGRGDGDVLVEQVTITGDASGAHGGREAVRCTRDGAELLGNVVEQPGDGYRRALGIYADEVVVSGGRYESSHHPIIIGGDDVLVTQTEARSYDGYEAVKLIEGVGNAKLVWSTFHEGFLVQTPDEPRAYGNEYPSA
jgi:hypothetical protein